MAYVYHWPPRVVLWELNVEQLAWWWRVGWRTWAREHGADVDNEQSQGDGPDKAAFRARYGAGKVIGR